MENQEGKMGCCENKDGVKCEHGMGCCRSWKKCRCIKVIFFIIILAIIFHIGVQCGEMKSEFRGNRFEGRGMMNWGGDRVYRINGGDIQEGTGSVTVEVTKPDTDTKAAAPAPKQ